MNWTKMEMVKEPHEKINNNNSEIIVVTTLIEPDTDMPYVNEFLWLLLFLLFVRSNVWANHWNPGDIARCQQTDERVAMW